MMCANWRDVDITKNARSQYTSQERSQYTSQERSQYTSQERSLAIHVTRTLEYTSQERSNTRHKNASLAINTCRYPPIGTALKSPRTLAIHVTRTLARNTNLPVPADRHRVANKAVQNLWCVSMHNVSMHNE
jgi:hypothetical protein